MHVRSARLVRSGRTADRCGTAVRCCRQDGRNALRWGCVQITRRSIVLAVSAVGPLLLATGCGVTTPAGAGATTPNIQPTNFVEVPPATTTSTTTSVPQGPLVAGTRSPTEQSYEIKPNDGLGKIAAVYDITLEQLVSYNQFPDGARQVIQPGQMIRIPPDALVPGTATRPEPHPETAGGADTETEDTDDATGTDTGAGCTHTIVAGEFPNRVANQYDITTEELYAANPGGVMDTFLSGATLNIPTNGNCD